MSTQGSTGAGTSSELAAQLSQEAAELARHESYTKMYLWVLVAFAVVVAVVALVMLVADVLRLDWVLGDYGTLLFQLLTLVFLIGVTRQLFDTLKVNQRIVAILARHVE